MSYYDSVRVTHSRPFDAQQRIVVGDNVIGELTTAFTDRNQVTASFSQMFKTRETLVRLTDKSEWKIATEIPTPLPKRKALGFTTQPKRPVSERRVSVRDEESSRAIAVYYEVDRSRYLKKDNRRFQIERASWALQAVPITTETGSLAMTARRKWYLWNGHDEFRLGMSIPLELVLLAWHVLRRDFQEAGRAVGWLMSD